MLDGTDFWPFQTNNKGLQWTLVSFICEHGVIKKILAHPGLLRGQSRSVTGHRRSLLIHVEEQVLSRMMMGGRSMRSPLLMCKHGETAWNGEVLPQGNIRFNIGRMNFQSADAR